MWRQGYGNVLAVTGRGRAALGYEHRTAASIYGFYRLMLLIRFFLYKTVYTCELLNLSSNNLV